MFQLFKTKGTLLSSFTSECGVPLKSVSPLSLSLFSFPQHPSLVPFPARTSDGQCGPVSRDSSCEVISSNTNLHCRRARVGDCASLRQLH